MPADSDAVDYLLERVSESDDENAVTSTFKNGKEYRIDGRVNGRMAIVIALVLTAIITLLSVQLFRSGISWFLLTPGIAISAAVSVFLIIRYFCFRVKIDSTGFYFRSNPFNGRYYEYSEIESCREEVKIYRHHHPPRTLYYYYFNFTDKSGRHVRFQFQKPLHGHEIDMLKKRIEKSGR